MRNGHRVTAPLVSVTGLTVRHGSTPILQDVDFSIAPGEIVTIVGPNGSGKSTLLRAILGGLRPVAGRVTHRPGLRLSYVPQRLVLDATLPMTVARFLSLPHRVTPQATGAGLARAGVPGIETRQMAALSGGQFQRVLLARALIAQPELLMLDEATAGLDQQGAASFYRQIEQVRTETGCAILMVSHDLHVVMSASDRVICVNGHICCEGTPEVVAEAPVYRALFGAGTQGALALYRHNHDHTHEPQTDKQTGGGHVHGASCEAEAIPQEAGK